jgi:Tfp pilus assembly protein FimV
VNDTQIWILVAVGISFAGYLLFRRSADNTNSLESPVDPVAEAEVYLAYGRKKQAQMLLENALRSDPSRNRY